MIRSTPTGVKAVARPASESPRQIQFAFRADPVALDDMRLSRTARAVFGLILDNARSRGGRCRLSNGTMARILGCCTMTIGRALVALEAAGMVRRELTAQGRIRLAIHVTWDGLQRDCLTVRPCVQQERGRGTTSVLKGVQHSCGTNQSPIQSENQTGPILPSLGEEDPEEAARFATLGPAGYLRAMIAKGKAEAAVRSGGKPAPRPAPPAVEPEPKPPTPPVAAKAPGVSQDDASREVGRLVRDLGQALKSETVGRWQGRQSADVQTRRFDAWRRGREVHSKLEGRAADPSVPAVFQVGTGHEIPLIPAPSTADSKPQMGPSSKLEGTRSGRGGEWKSSRS